MIHKENMFHRSYEAVGMPDPNPNEHKRHLSEGEAEQCPVLFAIVDAVELVEQDSW